MRPIRAALIALAIVGACKESNAPPETPGTAVAVDVSRCSAALLPPWFAFQDGPDAAWERVLVTGSRFEFEVHGQKFGYAWVGPNAPNGPFVRYTTLAELSSNPIMLCNGPGTATATVAGLAGGRGYVSFGGVQANSNVEAAMVTLAGVRDGVHDVLASLQGGTNSGRMILRRDVTPSGGSLGAFDFGGAEVFVPDTAALTVVNDLGDNVSYTVSYRTGPGCLYGRLPQGSILALEMLGVPAARQLPSDYHVIDAFAFAPSGGSNFRWVMLTHHALSDRTVVFGPDLGSVTVATLPGPYLRLQFGGTLPLAYDSYVSASYGGANMRATIAYLTDVAEVLAMPDLSGVAGWQNSWAPATGSTGTWIAQAWHNGATTPCTEGDITTGASAQGNY